MDILVYSFQNDGGFFYLYKNETSDQVLRETLAYQITGLEIESGGEVTPPDGVQKDGKWQVSIEVTPGK